LSLERRWARAVREAERCRRALSEDGVHDLRVAIRRLIATLDLVAVVLDDPGPRGLRRNLRKSLATLGALRDVQVQLLLLGPVAARHPSIEPLQTVLKVRERRLITRVKGRLASTTPETDAATLRRAAVKVPAAFRVRGAAVFAAATLAFARAVLCRETADPAQPDTIHRLRIAFKKFRYAAEALQPLLPGITKEMLHAMDAYQTRMGAIQDLEVLAESIRLFCMRSGPRGKGIPAPLVHELAGRRRVLLREFRRSADELYGFWRFPFPAPERKAWTFTSSGTASPSSAARRDMKTTPPVR